MPVLDIQDYAVLVGLCQLGMQGTVLKDFLLTEAGIVKVTKSTFYRRLRLLKEAGLVEQTEEEGIPFYVCTRAGKELCYALSVTIRNLAETAVEVLDEEFGEGRKSGAEEV